MKVLRTPEQRFVDLVDYAFTPHELEVDRGDGTGVLRVHYLDEGPADGQTVLLLHGQPTWSYIHRHVIPVLVRAGLCCVAPDLVGFGRSDKPAEPGDYTCRRHIDWMRSVVEQLDLRGVTLAGQDWGGFIGLRILADDPDRFARAVVSNTFLPTGEHDLGEGLNAWRTLSQQVPALLIGLIIDAGCTTDLTPDVVAAYEAPFPDERYKSGARRFPVLVPDSPDDPAAIDNRKAWETLREWHKPFLCAFSDRDPFMGGAERALRKRIPGARGLDHPVIRGAGHYPGEDRGPELGRVIAEFVASTPP